MTSPSTRFAEAIRLSFLMYDHPAVKRNISVLYQDGYCFIEPSEGYLACGYVGKGRLEEPENIVKLAEKHFAEETSAPLEGKHVVIDRKSVV